MTPLRICVVTGARSEYGLLRWIMQELASAAGTELRLIVTGAHLSPEFGLTWREIEADGFTIDERVDMRLHSDDSASLVRSMGHCALGIADALERLKPDWLMVLGDRYELLPVCSAALVMRIPIAHISGGDLTAGAIDDQIRYAVSAMASLHFPGTRESADRLVKRGENPARVFATGEPGLDNFLRLSRMTRNELAADLGLDPAPRWGLFTYHPETKRTRAENMDTVRAALMAMLEVEGLVIVATYANADEGGRDINEFLEASAYDSLGRLIVRQSLGQRRFVSFLGECVVVSGNSSSGIVEAPLFGIPVLNIGDRQRGRHLCSNVITCPADPDAIREAMRDIAARGFPVVAPDYHYGDGHSAERIVRIFLEKARVLGCK